MSAKPVGSAASAPVTSSEGKPRPPSSSNTPQNTGRSTMQPYTLSAPMQIPAKKKPHQTRPKS